MAEDDSKEITPLFGRLAAGDKTAVKECLDSYGNLIWKLAKQHTSSLKDAEMAASEIFKAIWQYAGKQISTELDEATMIVLLASRRLLKRQQEKNRNL